MLSPVCLVQRCLIVHSKHYKEGVRRVGTHLVLNLWWKKDLNCSILEFFPNVSFVATSRHFRVYFVIYFVFSKLTHPQTVPNVTNASGR